MVDQVAELKRRTLSSEDVVREAVSTIGRDPILNVREKTHGDFRIVADIAQNLKRVMRLGPNYGGMDNRQLESLDLIATKLARILAGDPMELDHWLDLAGYSNLGGEACD